MKKFFAAILGIALILGMVGCTTGPAASTTPPQATVEPAVSPTAEPDAEPTQAPDAEPTADPAVGADSLSALMDAINEGVEGLPDVGTVELNADNFEHFAFVQYFEGAEGFVSEALINALPHSVVLVRVPEGDDVQTVADRIEANADPRKWICVEAEKTIVSVHGNTILLVMSSADVADAIAANFDAAFAE